MKKAIKKSASRPKQEQCEVVRIGRKIGELSLAQRALANRMPTKIEHTETAEHALRETSEWIESLIFAASRERAQTLEGTLVQIALLNDIVVDLTQNHHPDESAKKLAETASVMFQSIAMLIRKTIGEARFEPVSELLDFYMFMGIQDRRNGHLSWIDTIPTMVAQARAERLA